MLLSTDYFTVWLVIFTGTNFCETSQNLVLIFIVGESGTHGLLAGWLRAEVMPKIVQRE